jgi:hypothetical protein
MNLMILSRGEGASHAVYPCFQPTRSVSTWELIALSCKLAERGDVFVLLKAKWAMRSY